MLSARLLTLRVDELGFFFLSPLRAAVCRPDGVEKHFGAERRDFVWRPSETFARVLTTTIMVAKRFAPCKQSACQLVVCIQLTQRDDQRVFDQLCSLLQQIHMRENVDAIFGDKDLVFIIELQGGGRYARDWTFCFAHLLAERHLELGRSEMVRMTIALAHANVFNERKRD